MLGNGNSLTSIAARRRPSGSAYSLAFDFGANRFTDVAGTVAANNGNAVAAVRSASGVLLTQATAGSRPTAAAGAITLAADYLETFEPTALFAAMGPRLANWDLALHCTVTDPSVTQYLFSLGLSTAPDNTRNYFEIRVQSDGIIRALFEDGDSVSGSLQTPTAFVAAGVETLLWFRMRDGTMTLDAYTADGLIASDSNVIAGGDRVFDRMAVGALRRTGTTVTLPMTGSFKSLEFWQL